MSTESPNGPEPAEPAFDPYRFGAPTYPIDPAYAPPGYVPPAGYSSPPVHPGYPPPAASYPAPGSGYPPPAGYGGYPPPPQGGPPPYGYGYPPSPYQQKSSNGFAVAGLVLGIASVLFSWATILDLVLIVPAIVFAALGLGRARAGARGKAIALTGLILAIVAVIIAVIVLVVITKNCDQTTSSSGNTSFSCSFDNN